GVITGDTHLMEFNNDMQTSISNPNGILSGIIGSDGAVAVFLSTGTLTYEGGFIAVPVANANTWERSFASQLNTNPTNKDQFLKIAGKTISDTAVGFTKSPSSPPTLDFSEFTYGGESLVGLSDDNGLAYFRGSFAGTFYQYVGIFGTTDLGARITDDNFSATWVGKFRIPGESVKDFTLAVTFGGTTGAVDGFLIDVEDTLDFLIDGEFDANGVITGDVDFLATEFTSHANPPTPTTFNGTLSGIIGLGGAVGVFLSNAGEDSYRGGFVAIPTATGPLGIACAADGGDPICPDDDAKVTASDWGRVQPAPLNTNPTPGNQFLKIAGKTISTIGTTSSSSGGGAPLVGTLDFTLFSSAIPMGLDANDGLAYVRGWFRENGSPPTNTRHSYAGIYGSTDLGVRIVDSGMDATWAAKLQLDGNSKDFDLTVTFDGADGTVKTFIENLFSAVHFSIDGRFGANGVITGKVHHAFGTHPTSPDDFDGTLSGIIGQDGAVAVFHNTSGNIYGGGFIAVPPPPPPPSVDADAWVSSFTSPGLSTTPTAGNQFLQIADKTISTSGTRRRAAGAAGEIPLVRTLDFSAFSSGTIPLGLDADDGLAYFRGWIGADRHSYAGIYASTNLGAPITESGMDATWPAELRLNNFAEDFTLKVTFDGTNGKVEAFIQNVDMNVIISDRTDFSIDGRFDANGVITGGVHYDDATHPTSPDEFEGTLSGIIGQDGAVGVFVLDSGSNAGTNGGFIAAPAR
ncbi:MAG: hypothetical protein K8953_09645, partial [Proteobacteria bacterium]|nr:hypothetical protein [Pseudomonadota bacterium]